MRLLVVSRWNVSSLASWSGAIRPMVEELRAFADVDVLQLSNDVVPLVDRIYMTSIGRISRRTFVAEQSMLSSIRQSAELEARLNGSRFDAIVGLAASPAFAFLRTTVPVLQVSDATVQAIINYYPMFSRLDPIYASQMKFVDRRSTHNTQGFSVASDWAKDSLERDYGVSPSKIVVAPFGPSIKPGFTGPFRVSSVGLRVLFVSSDWERKGGALVVEAVNVAQRSGIDLDLTVVGNAPSLSSDISQPGRLSPVEMSKIYETSDVIIELSRASAGGVVLTDAAHFGLPAIAINTGGVPNIVTHGENGFLIDEESSDEQAVLAAMGYLVQYAQDRELLRHHSQSALTMAKSRNNWGEWGSRVNCLLQRIT